MRMKELLSIAHRISSTLLDDLLQYRQFLILINFDLSAANVQ